MRFSLLVIWLLVLFGCGSSGGGSDTVSSAVDRSSSSRTNSSAGGGAALLSSLTFEDPVFAQCVRGSGVETVAELKVLECYLEEMWSETRPYQYVSQKITSIKGIEQLTSLEILELSYTELVAVDLSNNPTLIEVILFVSKLDNINLNGLTSLEKLSVASVEIQHLDLSQNPNLQELMLYSVPLSQIDLGSLGQLRKLHLHDTLISNIDFSDIPGIEELDISLSPIASLNSDYLNDLETFIIGADDEIFKRMTRLDDSGETIFLSSAEVPVEKLKSLRIHDGVFKSIDLSVAASLETLRFEGGYVENFDLTSVPNLKVLSLWGSSYFSEKASALTVYSGCNLHDISLNYFDMGDLNLSFCKSLSNLELYDGSSVDALDLSELDQLETLSLHGNNLSALSLPAGDSLKEFSLSDDKLPLVSLINSPSLSYVNLSLPRSGDHQIELGDIRNIEILEVDGGVLNSTSPNNFTNLNTLRSYGSRLGDLDLSISSALEGLYISDDNGMLNTLQLPVIGELSQLTINAANLKSLYVGDLKKLESVDLKLSAESRIDLSKAPAITVLALDGFSSIYLPEMAPLKILGIHSGSGISQLDLRGYLELERLLVSDNDIAYIDLSDNNRIQDISVYNTALEQIELPKSSESDELRLSVEGDRNLEILKIGSLTRLDLRVGPDTHIDLSSTYRLKELLVSDVGALVLPPDNGLEILALYDVEPEVINISDYPMLEYLTLHNTGLKEVEINNSRLKQVGLSGLDLEHVSLGNLPQLKELSISESGVLEVDLSGVSNIDDLWLSGVAIESEQLASLPLLKYLTLNDLPVASLALPNESELERIMVFGGDLETLYVGDQPNLTDMFIASPKLANVDFSGLPNMETLSLYHSLLQDLDLSVNPVLRDLTLYGNQLSSLNLDGLNKLERVQLFDEEIPCENLVYDGDLYINCVSM